MPPSLTLTWCPSTPTPTMAALQAAAKTSMLHHHQRHQPKIAEEMYIQMLATLHLTLVPNCINFLDTNARPPKIFTNRKQKREPSLESKHLKTVLLLKKFVKSKSLPKSWYNSLAAELFTFELEELKTVGLHCGLTSLSEPWKQGNWKLFTQNLLWNLHSSYPTVFTFGKKKLKLHPCKRLVSSSNNQDLLTWRWAKHVNSLLPCVWTESYRISEKHENRCPPFLFWTLFQHR